MLFPTIVMGVLAAILLIVGATRGEGQHVRGIQMAGRLMLQVLPLLFCAFTVASMVQLMIPAESIARWIGPDAGFRGILLGSVAGGLAPGGPFVSMPIAAALVGSGAGIGTVVAFMTGWSLWAVARLPMEVSLLGWQITLARLASTAILPPLAGIIAHVLFERG